MNEFLVLSFAMFELPCLSEAISTVSEANSEQPNC